MIKAKGTLRILLLVTGMLLSAMSARVHAQHEHHSHDEPKPAEKNEPVKEKIPAAKSTPETRKIVEAEKTPTPSVGLAELEQWALANNPTLRQAELAIRAAEGRKTQAGLFPNPVVGFSADDLSFRNSGDGGKYGFFIEQKIPLGGKLAKSRRVGEQDVLLADVVNQAQRARVLNSVRLLYAEALGAQTLAELKKELAKLAEDSVETQAELYNVGLADRPDQLKTEISRKRAEAEYFDAVNKFEAVWQKLAAMVGRPEMPPARLSGNPADFTREVNAGEWLANLLEESPEIKAAKVKAERARLALRRARSEKTPDLYLRGGVNYNNEILESVGGYKKAGAEVFLEVGVSLPIFDRNQGGVKTAEAELAIAEREVERLQLVLRTRFAEMLSSYRTHANFAERYRTEIVPKARAAYEMYEANFQAMTAAYTRVLETHAGYLRAQVEYARHLAAAQQSLILLKGFLLSGGLNAPAGSETAESDEPKTPSENAGGEDEDQ